MKTIETKYENGNLKEQYGEILDLNGKTIRDGQYTCWYENGKKKKEYFLKNGEFDGAFTFWNENGQKIVECIYKMGEIVYSRPE